MTTIAKTLLSFICYDALYGEWYITVKKIKKLFDSTTLMFGDILKLLGLHSSLNNTHYTYHSFSDDA